MLSECTLMPNCVINHKIDPYCVTYDFAIYIKWLHLWLYLFRAPISICHIDGLVQERHNSIANALELRLSCTNPSIWYTASSLLTFNLKAYHVCAIRKTSPTVRLRHIYLPAFLRLYSDHWRWKMGICRSTCHTFRMMTSLRTWTRFIRLYLLISILNTMLDQLISASKRTCQVKSILQKVILRCSPLYWTSALQFMGIVHFQLIHCSDDQNDIRNSSC